MTIDSPAGPSLVVPAGLVAAVTTKAVGGAAADRSSAGQPPRPGHGGGGGSAPGGGGGQSQGPSLHSRGLSERLLKVILAVFAFVPLVALGLVVAAMVIKAYPAIPYNGIGFFIHSAWMPGNFYGNAVVTHGVSHPPGASYGALPLIMGTLASSLIAIVLAVPMGIGTALIIVEKLPARLSSGVGFCLEVLAGVPSVVFGLWGALTLGPFLAHHVSPLLAHHVPDVPVLSFFRGNTGAGEGLFSSGVVLAIMILPIIAATTRDLLRQVPRLTVEGAVALGMTDSESVRTVTIPWVRSGILGATVLGLGRALGETMAVAMVSGTVLGSNIHNLYQTMTTVAATIVSQLDSSLTDASGFAVRTLAEAGLVLLVITLAVNIGARMLVRRVSTTALPVGRGI